MEPIIWGFIGTLAGTVVGASSSIATTFITARNSRKLQQGAASLEQAEKAREFQRNNLLELQEALSAGMRLIGLAHIEDIESFRKSENKDRTPLLSEELNQKIMISDRKISILTERVSNDSLRDGIKNLCNEMTDSLMARTENEGIMAMSCVSSTFKKTMEHLGVLLRGNY